MLLLALALAGVALGVNCTFAANEIVSYERVMDCYAVFPFNATVARHTTDNLAKAMQLYAFRDIAKAPPAPFNAVDLDKSLAAIGSSQFASDAEFQDALRAVFLQLHDAHTNVYAPTPYASFTFFLPVTLFSYANASGALTLEVSDVLNRPEGWPEVNVSSWVGAVVEQIEGVPAAQFVDDFAANHVGSCKDPQTRFNIALLQRPPLDGYNGTETPWLGLLTWRPHHFALAPQQPGLTFAVRFPNGTALTQTLQFKAFSSRDFASTEEYEQSYWANASATMSGKPQKKKRAEKTLTGLPPVPVMNATVDGLGFYTLGNDTLVWYQNTFEPADYNAYYSTVILSLLYAQEHSLSKLILDFSMNGGGDLCLGRGMLELLFPNSPNFGPTDLPATPLAVNLSATAAAGPINDTEWSPNFYLSAVGLAPFTDNGWMVPGIKRQRGGVTSNYSQLVVIASTPATGECGIPPVLFTQPLFAPENVVFLSRGFCGSTCALFADTLHDYLGIRTVAVGGTDPAVGMAYRSFPGLQVLESDYLYGVLDELRQDTGRQECSDCLAPRRLLTTAAFRLCNREVYRSVSDTATPLEYTQQNADERLQFTRETALNPSALWHDVQQRFLE